MQQLASAWDELNADDMGEVNRLLAAFKEASVGEHESALLKQMPKILESVVTFSLLAKITISGQVSVLWH